MKNEEFKRAFVRSLEIISEASKNIPRDIKKKISSNKMEKYHWNERQDNSRIFWS